MFARSLARLPAVSCTVRVCNAFNAPMFTRSVSGTALTVRLSSGSFASAKGTASASVSVSATGPLPTVTVVIRLA